MAKLLCILMLLLPIEVKTTMSTDLVEPPECSNLPADQLACFVVGTSRHGILKVCPKGYEQIGNKCYPQCKNGYTGNEGMCIMNCPPGLIDIGISCTSIWAKECCSPTCCGDCPEDHIDIGCFCATNIDKENYTRGFGTDSLCLASQDEIEGLCYPKCHDNQIGLGPMCLARGPHEDAGQDKRFFMPCDQNSVFYANHENTCKIINKELKDGGNVTIACIASLLGSAIVPISRLEVVGRACGSNIHLAAKVVNKILTQTGARSCNSSSHSGCCISKRIHKA